MSGLDDKSKTTARFGTMVQRPPRPLLSPRARRVLALRHIAEQSALEVRNLQSAIERLQSKLVDDTARAERDRAAYEKAQQEIE